MECFEHLEKGINISHKNIKLKVGSMVSTSIPTHAGHFIFGDKGLPTKKHEMHLTTFETLRLLDFGSRVFKFETLNR